MLQVSGSAYVFDGFARVGGRLLARFRHGQDVRAVALEDGGIPQSDAEEMPEQLRLELAARAAEMAALVRTAAIVHEHDAARRGLPLAQRRPRRAHDEGRRGGVRP